MLFRTVQALRALGFQIQRASDAIDCTEVSADFLFFSALARHLAPMSDAEMVLDQLHPGTPHEGRVRLLVAGIFDDTAEFPFALFTPEEHKTLQGIALRARAAREAQLLASQQWGRAASELGELLNSR